MQDSTGGTALKVRGGPMGRLSVLSAERVDFPPADAAMEDPNGLLAVGGALTPDWLLSAYAAGIFPWFEDDASPILWWSPNPRAVLFPDRLKVSRSLAKRIRNGGFRLTIDEAFADVVRGCAQPRARAASGTWITPDMIDAYVQLHRMGYAHSVESWRDGALVGGLYGVSLGRMFFGESMFAIERDASKVAFHHLVQTLLEWEFTLIDCQIMNDHLRSLGAIDMPRSQFLALLAQNRRAPTRAGSWSGGESPGAGP